LKSLAKIIYHFLLDILFSTINYSLIDFLFVDSHRNESLSNLFSIDSQGFLHTLVILDRELQSNYTLSIFIYDSILKSYSLPTSIFIQVLDDNDNLPYEPFLSNPFDLIIEQINNEETIIYEFKPTDLDDGLNGMISIDCLNCSSTYYFHLIINNFTNSSILITNSNVTIPDGKYTLAFILRDHGLFISRERIYTLTFNLTHRLINEKEDEKNEEEYYFLTTSSIPFLIRQKNFLSNFILQKYQWRFLIVLIISWLILVLIAIWTCYRYNRISRSKKKEKEEQEQFEIQVRQHEIISSPIPILPKSSLLPTNSQQIYEKETLTQDDDEVEDTSYDADHIITDANFVLTSGCTTNESNVRYVSFFLFVLFFRKNTINRSIKC
jgi:hypothetical protein